MTSVWRAASLGAASLVNLVLLTLLGVVLLAGCGGSGGGGGGAAPPPGSTPGALSGRVADQGGVPLGNAQIMAPGAGAATVTATTNEQGFFVLEGVAEGAVALRVTHDGYVAGLEPVTVVRNQVTQVAVRLQQVGTTETVDVAQAATITHQGGSVSLPAGGVVDQNGGVVAQAQVQVTTMTPGDPNYLEVFPGSFTGVRTGGEEVLLESFGVIDTELRDAQGGELRLAAGSLATVRFPIPNPDPASATIPIWSLDTVTGRWIEEGIATRDDQAGVYAAQVSHFSPWNLDGPVPRATKIVRLTFQGQPVIGTTVRLLGENGRWSAGGATGLDGSVTLSVTAGELANVMMLLPNGSWQVLARSERMPGPGGSLVNEFDENDGVIIAPVTVSLIWGQQPTDLDSHLTIPPAAAGGDRQWVFFARRGSLVEQPFAALDTDDVTSFGPEIVTVSRLQAGRYRYTVHNYSRYAQHPIEQSGCRVVLQIRGQAAQAWTPPPANPSQADYWAVFDLTVDGAGGAVVTPVNQYGTQGILDAPGVGESNAGLPAKD